MRPGLTVFEPHGSWAPIWATLSLGRELNFADYSVCNLPLIIGADQSPPVKPRVLKVRCRALSSEESRASVILLANPDQTRNVLLDIEGVSATARLGMLATPAQCGRAEPPNLLLQSVGKPWSLCTGKHIKRYASQNRGLGLMTHKVA